MINFQNGLTVQHLIDLQRRTGYSEFTQDIYDHIKDNHNITYNKNGNIDSIDYANGVIDKMSYEDNRTTIMSSQTDGNTIQRIIKGGCGTDIFEGALVTERLIDPNGQTLYMNVYDQDSNNQNYKSMHMDYNIKGNNPGMNYMAIGEIYSPNANNPNQLIQIDYYSNADNPDLDYSLVRNETTKEFDVRVPGHDGDIRIADLIKDIK